MVHSNWTYYGPYRLYPCYGSRSVAMLWLMLLLGPGGRPGLVADHTLPTAPFRVTRHARMRTARSVAYTRSQRVQCTVYSVQCTRQGRNT